MVQIVEQAARSACGWQVALLPFKTIVRVVGLRALRWFEMCAATRQRQALQILACIRPASVLLLAPNARLCFKVVNAREGEVIAPVLADRPHCGTLLGRRLL